MIDLNSYRKEISGLKGISMLLLLFASVIANEQDTLLLSPLRELCLSAIDMFFLLSGFLISFSLLHKKSRKDYYYNYFKNKFLRVLILYYSFVILFQFILPPLTSGIVGVPKPFLSSPIWYWAFISNIKIFLDNNWSDEVLTLSWSLAIGVQFFLIWPFAVKTLKPELLRKLCWAFFSSSLILRFIFFICGFSEAQACTFTLSRLDSISLGCLLALELFENQNTFKALRSYQSIVLACISVFYLLDFLVYEFDLDKWIDIFTSSFFYTANSIVYLLITIEALSAKDNFIRVTLRNKFLNYLGIISYPLFFCIGFIPETIYQIGFPYIFLDDNWAADALYYLTSMVLTISMASLIYFVISKASEIIRSRLKYN